MQQNNIKNLIIANSTIVENELERIFSKYGDNKLVQAMKYSLLAGGKRLRPFIVLEVYKAFSNNEDISRALPFACAIEMIHTYSLIHDDLPCMDNDDYRRGKLTNHKVYGEAEALLAGDSLLTHAFEIVSNNLNVTEKSVLLAIKCLSTCSGILGMAGGQMIDLNASKIIRSYDQLTKMHAMKTGALIKCAALLGYYAYTDAPNSKIENQLETFATNLGIAFQIRDDVLDEISSSEQLGKAVGSDKKNEKITALSYINLKEAQQEINRLTNASIEAVRGALGEKAYVLVELAKYLIERDK